MMSRLGFYAARAYHAAWAALNGSAYSPAQIAVARESWNYWKSIGATDRQASWLVGCQCRETSFIPSAVGDHDQARGAFQWHKARRDAILSHTGIDVWSGVNIDALKGAHAEMTIKWVGNPYYHDWSDLMAAANDNDGNTVLIHEYEQSGSQASDLAKQNGFSAYFLSIFGAAA